MGAITNSDFDFDLLWKQLRAISHRSVEVQHPIGKFKLEAKTSGSISVSMNGQKIALLTSKRLPMQSEFLDILIKAQEKLNAVPTIEDDIKSIINRAKAKFYKK